MNKNITPMPVFVGRLRHSRIDSGTLLSSVVNISDKAANNHTVTGCSFFLEFSSHRSTLMKARGTAGGADLVAHSQNTARFDYNVVP